VRRHWSTEASAQQPKDLGALPMTNLRKEFEGQVVDDLQDMSISAVSDRMGISWHAVGRIMERAVERGLHGGGG